MFLQLQVLSKDIKMEQNTHNEGNQMVKGISMIGLVALASGTVTGVGFLMMSGDIVNHVGRQRCYVRQENLKQ